VVETEIRPAEFPLVTIAIPVLNEERFVEDCLESLFAGTYPKDRLEVLVLDGGSSDRTVEIVEQIGKSHLQIRILENPGRIQAKAMNIAIDEAAGEMIVRLDAHSKYQSNHVEKIVERLVAGDAENVSGVQLPVGSGFFGNLAAACLRSSLSMGASSHRVASGPAYSESVFLGGWKTKTLRDLGGFNPDWEVNEDYELNVRLRESGGRVMVLPELECEYIVRSTPSALAKQYYRYGFWRARTIRCHRSAARMRHAAPLVLLLALVASFGVLGAGSSYGLIVPIVYALMLLFAGAKVVLSERRLSSVVAPAVFGLIHLSWGAGLLFGAMRSAVASGGCSGGTAPTGQN
jgi:succinoglycan biosynthesis protein ExoA